METKDILNFIMCNEIDSALDQIIMLTENENLSFQLKTTAVLIKFRHSKWRTDNIHDVASNAALNKIIIDTVNLLDQIDRDRKIIKKVEKIPVEKELVYLEKLENRETLYKTAKRMISDSKYQILDTTWGISPAPKSDSECIARQLYRDEADQAIIRGVGYKDLFSTAKRQIDELNEVAERNKKFNNYEGKCLYLIKKDLPVIDMLITDDEEIILSNISYNGAIPIPKFLYIKSKQIVIFYSTYFNECWNKAKVL